jgi:hypothetical protein
VVDTVDTSSSEILILLLKVTHFQIKLPNKQCSKPSSLSILSYCLVNLLGVFSYIMDYIYIYMDHASLESNIAGGSLGIPLYQRYERIMIIPEG